MKGTLAQALLKIDSDREAGNRLMKVLLKSLWTVVAEPIFSHLGFPGGADDSTALHRVWWLTTG